jgi:hypothetical protein
MIYTIVGAGTAGAGAASRYGSGSDQKMRLLAAPAPQHWIKQSTSLDRWNITRYCIRKYLIFSKVTTLVKDLV